MTQVKVAFALHVEDNWPPVAVETVWCNSDNLKKESWTRSRTF